MGRSLHSLILEMTGKIQLIFIGALLFLVVLSASENSKDDSLTEEGGKARLTRAAKSDSGRKKSQIKKKSKKGKKGKKSKMAKRKKQKKNKSNKKNNQKSQPKQDIPESCLKESVDGLYKGYYKKASNFERQLARINIGLQILSRKPTKTGVFNQSAEDIASIASSCPTPEERFEAELLAAKLRACHQEITDSCQTPEVNRNQIDMCTPIVEGFQNETIVCKDLYGDDACNCWQKPDFKTLYDGLSGCNIKDSETNVTVRLRECKSAFSDCRKAQREAFSLYAQCNPERLVGSTPKTPKVNQTLGFIPRWGPFFQIKLEALIETYDYRDEFGEYLWGQIVRFQALNGTGLGGAAGGGDCCDVGSRIPIIQVTRKPNGVDRLQVTSAIFNNYSVENDFYGNSVFNFTGVDAPDVGKYFNITITQLPPLIQSPDLSLPWEFTVTIEQEGKQTQVQSAPNYDPIVFEDVTVWSIDDIPVADQDQPYVPINGSIKNLCIWK